MSKDSEVNINREQKSSPRRGGLGRGLGALIPSSQAEEEISRARPLDVLFPDLQKNSKAGESVLGTDSSSQVNSSRPRGGSARELLTPRNVRSAKSDPSSREKKAISKDSLEREIVSRETSDPSVSSQKRSLKQNAHEIVSRETKSIATEESLVEVPGASFGMLAVEAIIPNTRQPRQNFEQSEIEELAASLKEVGLLQPIVVRPINTEETPSTALLGALRENPQAQYELIMGERRLRASQLAGLLEIPAIVRETEDENLLRDALLENLHRVQLNPLEEAAAYEQLLNDFACTQEELAGRIARSRPQIANTLRLLRLPAVVQKKVAAGVISAGHARALLGLNEPEQMVALANRIINEGLSVRATEEIVRLAKGEPVSQKVKNRTAAEPSALAVRVMGQVSDYLDTRVSITEGKSKGKIVIDFADQADLQRISDLLGRN